MKPSFRLNPNSLKNTFCVFIEMPMDTVTHFSLEYQSKSGSKYFYTTEGMYRLSNHWGKLANSKWHLKPLDSNENSKIKLGFALWEHFYPDNSFEKLYFIEVDYEKKTAHYQHKNDFNFDNKAILRTSFETAKKIKQIRNLLNLTSWAKHFESLDLESLRKKIITQLIYTNKTLDQVKRELQWDETTKEI